MLCKVMQAMYIELPQQNQISIAFLSTDIRCDIVMFKDETEQLSQYIYTFYLEIDWGNYCGWESWQKLVSGSSFIYSLFAGILDDTIMKLSERGNLLAGEYSIRDL